MKFELHPLCEIFPAINASEIAALAEDIKLHGQRDPIVILDGKILDGQNRYAACLLAGIKPKFVKFDGDDPLAFVISVNLRRRHLDESQRAFIADSLAKLRDGQRKSPAQICAPDQQQAADMMKVSRRSVQTARKVREKGTKKLGEMVRDGQVSLNAAVAISELPKEEQTKITRKGPTAVKEVAKGGLANYSENRRSDLSVYCSGTVTNPTVSTPKIIASAYTDGDKFAFSTGHSTLATTETSKPSPVIVVGHIPSVKTTPSKPSRDERLLTLLRQIEANCPCGARPESPTTHPHALNCPVDLAIVILTTS